jgi:hypothetical protein
MGFYDKPFFLCYFSNKDICNWKGSFNEKKKKKDCDFKYVYLGIIALFIFIVYLIVFNLVNITMDTPQYISKLAMTASSIKNQIVDNSVFYGFLLLLLVSFLIPAYMKYKR